MEAVQVSQPKRSVRGRHAHILVLVIVFRSDRSASDIMLLLLMRSCFVLRRPLDIGLTRRQSNSTRKRN